MKHDCSPSETPHPFFKWNEKNVGSAFVGTKEAKKEIHSRYRSRMTRVQYSSITPRNRTSFLSLYRTVQQEIEIDPRGTSDDSPTVVFYLLEGISFPNFQHGSKNG